jgi:hypothetical protein
VLVAAIVWLAYPLWEFAIHLQGQKGGDHRPDRCRDATQSDLPSEGSTSAPGGALPASAILGSSPTTGSEDSQVRKTQLEGLHQVRSGQPSSPGT